MIKEKVEKKMRVEVKRKSLQSRKMGKMFDNMISEVKIGSIQIKNKFGKEG